MKHIITTDQARELDNISMKERSIPGLKLMDAAGKAIADEIKFMVAEIHNPRIFIVCGKGNNGGDGFATAFYLKGYSVHIFSIPEAEDINGDSGHFHARCLAEKIHIHYGRELPLTDMEWDLGVDAILGTGFKGELRENILSWTTWMNDLTCPILAIDCPTGLDGNKGNATQGSINAKTTVTMGYPKLGLCMKDGPGFTGVLKTADIGFPDIYNELTGLKWFQFQDEDAHNSLVNIKRDTYKHRQGKVLIIAGSKGMTGAAVLSTFGALRSGAGLTITCAPESIEDIYEKTIIEGMTVGCPDHGSGFLIPSAYEQISDKFDWCNVVVIGPGLGENEETKQLVEHVIIHSPKPLVIDADALRIFYGKTDLFHSINVPFIITPHEGEFCNLLNTNREYYLNNFPNNVEKFMSKFNGALVLKNAPTISSYGETAVVNSTGNPGMATAGMGDVLSGMMGTLLAQSDDIFYSARMAVYLHGKAGDLMAEEKGKRGLIASDLLDMLPTIIKEYE